MSSKIEEKRRDHSEGRRGRSVQQASQGKKSLAAAASGEDDLTRLIRIIARQAAQEAFSVFKASLDARAVEGLPLLDRSKLEHAPEGDPGKGRGPPQPGERFLSVAEIAKQLGVAEKTIRRRIASGDLPAHRVGKLIRVSERVLPAYVTRAHPKSR
jgi:excisionase family DNA binding protein